MTNRFLNRTQILAAQLDDVFDFFSNPHNLEKITPAFLNFNIQTSEQIEVAEGTLIAYKLSLHGFKLKWISRISAWNPPHYFVDEQVKGPYKKWVHEHIFEDSNGKTIVQDKVSYQVPGGILEPLIHRLFVEQDLVKIFDFRAKVLAEIWDKKNPPLT